MTLIRNSGLVFRVSRYIQKANRASVRNVGIRELRLPIEAGSMTKMGGRTRRSVQKARLATRARGVRRDTDKLIMAGSEMI
jgi:hypothetical protein